LLARLARLQSVGKNIHQPLVSAFAACHPGIGQEKDGFVSRSHSSPPLANQQPTRLATKVNHAFEIVEAMKAEGIYTHFSIDFPLGFTPAPDTAWLKGYDGKQHPFAALLFNPEFQARYRK
jgi:hypothetical protein